MFKLIIHWNNGSSDSLEFDSISEAMRFKAIYDGRDNVRIVEIEYYNGHYLGNVVVDEGISDTPNIATHNVYDSGFRRNNEYILYNAETDEYELQVGPTNWSFIGSIKEEDDKANTICCLPKHEKFFNDNYDCIRYLAGKYRVQIDYPIKIEILKELGDSQCIIIDKNCYRTYFDMGNLK